ncbi:hypothetical protein B0H14DRAFT_2565587 [Mycena olivaceomarginata]|nr:hypothetical protein B0H14DRAFT_2565587 [Mycena olivaceomarginata]
MPRFWTENRRKRSIRSEMQEIPYPFQCVRAWRRKWTAWVQPTDNRDRLLIGANWRMENRMNSAMSESATDFWSELNCDERVDPQNEIGKPSAQASKLVCDGKLQGPSLPVGIPRELNTRLKHLATSLKNLPSSIPPDPSQSSYTFSLDPDDVKDEGNAYAFNRALELAFQISQASGRAQLLFTERGKRLVALEKFGGPKI